MEIVSWYRRQCDRMLGVKQPPLSSIKYIAEAKNGHNQHDGKKLQLSCGKKDQEPVQRSMCLVFEITHVSPRCMCNQVAIPRNKSHVIFYSNNVRTILQLESGTANAHAIFRTLRQNMQLLEHFSCFKCSNARLTAKVRYPFFHTRLTDRTDEGVTTLYTLYTLLSNVHGFRCPNP